MKAYIFRELETTEEVSNYGDKHSIINYERIVVTKTAAVSVKVIPKKNTWSGKEITFLRPIWRSESGELFIEEMLELGCDLFLAGDGSFLLRTPRRTPCRINGEILTSYSYSEYYYTE